MIRLPSAIEPYALAIKIGVAAVLLTAAFVGGCTVQRGRNAAALAERDVRIGQLTADAGSAVSANADWEILALETHARLAQCQAQWQAERTSASAAVAQARSGWAEAERDAELFRAQFQAITDSCSTALAVMQDACEQEIGAY